MSMLRTLLFGKENRIGRRLIVLIIAFSSLITLCISVVQLAYEYRGLRSALDRQLDDIRIYVPTIEGSVWDFDEKQIQRALDALVLLPNIAVVRVTAADSDRQWSAGKSRYPDVVTRRYSLRHDHRGVDTETGTLELVASLEGIYDQVIASAISIVVSNALKTFLVALFMVYLIRKLITVRLERMADKVHGLVPIPAALDELDTVDWTLDKTTDDLGIAVSTLRDMNERLESTVRERTHDLETANQELKTFSYTLSHDMRAPLRAMSGFSAILKEDFAERLGEDGDKLVARIVAAAERMDALINDTLGLYKVSASTFKCDVVDLTRIAKDVVEQLAHGDADRKVEWQIEEGMQAEGDAGLLRTVFENLIGNAWKYSGKRAVAQIAIGKQKDHDGVIYFVKDNGAGFDMAYADRLFAPFQRLHHESEFTGNGVGLATVRKIITRHEGRIWADSAVDQGATFHFTLFDPVPEQAA